MDKNPSVNIPSEILKSIRSNIERECSKIASLPPPNKVVIRVSVIKTQIKNMNYLPNILALKNFRNPYLSK